MRQQNATQFELTQERKAKPQEKYQGLYPFSIRASRDSDPPKSTNNSGKYGRGSVLYKLEVLT